MSAEVSEYQSNLANALEWINFQVGIGADVNGSNDLKQQIWGSASRRLLIILILLLIIIVGHALIIHFWPSISHFIDWMTGKLQRHAKGHSKEDRNQTMLRMVLSNNGRHGLDGRHRSLGRSLEPFVVTCSGREVRFTPLQKYNESFHKPSDDLVHDLGQILISTPDPNPASENPLGHKYRHRAPLGDEDWDRDPLGDKDPLEDEDRDRDAMEDDGQYSEAGQDDYEPGTAKPARINNCGDKGLELVVVRKKQVGWSPNVDGGEGGLLDLGSQAGKGGLGQSQAPGQRGNRDEIDMGEGPETEFVDDAFGGEGGDRPLPDFLIFPFIEIQFCFIAITGVTQASFELLAASNGSARLIITGIASFELLAASNGSARLIVTGIVGLFVILAFIVAAGTAIVYLSWHHRSLGVEYGPNQPPDMEYCLGDGKTEKHWGNRKMVFGRLRGAWGDQVVYSHKEDREPYRTSWYHSTLLSVRVVAQEIQPRTWAWTERGSLDRQDFDSHLQIPQKGGTGGMGSTTEQLMDQVNNLQSNSLAAGKAGLPPWHVAEKEGLPPWHAAPELETPQLPGATHEEGPSPLRPHNGGVPVAEGVVLQLTSPRTCAILTLPGCVADEGELIKQAIAGLGPASVGEVGHVIVRGGLAVPPPSEQYMQRVRTRAGPLCEGVERVRMAAGPVAEADEGTADRTSGTGRTGGTVAVVVDPELHVESMNGSETAMANILRAGSTTSTSFTDAHNAGPPISGQPSLPSALDGGAAIFLSKDTQTNTTTTTDMVISPGEGKQGGPRPTRGPRPRSWLAGLGTCIQVGGVQSTTKSAYTRSALAQPPASRQDLGNMVMERVGSLFNEHKGTTRLCMCFRLYEAIYKFLFAMVIGISTGLNAANRSGTSIGLLVMALTIQALYLYFASWLFPWLDVTLYIYFAFIQTLYIYFAFYPGLYDVECGAKLGHWV
eukprot:gene11100-18716_t